MDNNNTRKQPPWIEPQRNPSPELKVYNSLTRSKSPFIPKNGKQVTWYICGPTVYDASHMGHARNYVSFDYIRRILNDYFGYDVHMVMNITDIDDKIIVRSRELGISFTELARKWEADFLEDMNSLKVQPPDVLTRVSEYIPQILKCITGILDNKFAYVSNESVYFDTAAFSKTHSYAKLEPENFGNTKLMNEGEGSLSSGASEKRNPSDFALWKKSKEGEPKWESPWGWGRPGWHIECSAMASDILGEVLDVHSGGEDLRFPHHDNELAQSEAYFGSQQWVNYFIHSGHLHINGCKMSKSLKNFITIKDALSDYNPRQIRMLFLLHRYDAIMDYSKDSMGEAINVDKIFSEFFHNVKAIIRAQTPNDAQFWGDQEKQLNATFQQTKQKVHESLCDNFYTPGVIHQLMDLVKTTNIYIAANTGNLRSYLLRSIADYITRLFKIFGLIDNSAIGYVSTDTNSESVLGPVLDAFNAFRSQVRSAVKENQPKKVLEMCDSVRDDVLPVLGIRLSDLPDGTAIWKLDDKEVLKKEMLQRKEIEEQKKAARENKEKKEKEKLEKAKIPAEQMFLSQTDKYSKFDEKGIPTHDQEGKPLSKSAAKKVLKDYEQQKKLHDSYLESQSDNNNAKN